MRLIDSCAFKKILSEHEMEHDKRRSFDDYDCGAANAYEHASDLLDEMPTIEPQHGTCKTCKHYNPYREQFSYRNRGDGYCKSTITTSEGQAYINCHDEWYCANYEKGGSK